MVLSPHPAASPSLPYLQGPLQSLELGPEQIIVPRACVKRKEMSGCVCLSFACFHFCAAAGQLVKRLARPVRTDSHASPSTLLRWTLTFLVPLGLSSQGVLRNCLGFPLCHLMACTGSARGHYLPRDKPHQISPALSQTQTLHGGL